MCLSWVFRSNTVFCDRIPRGVGQEKWNSRSSRCHLFLTVVTYVSQNTCHFLSSIDTLIDSPDIRSSVYPSDRFAPASQRPFQPNHKKTHQRKDSVLFLFFHCKTSSITSLPLISFIYLQTKETEDGTSIVLLCHPMEPGSCVPLDIVSREPIGLFPPQDDDDDSPSGRSAYQPTVLRRWQ
jgi:hypothetical protein